MELANEGAQEQGGARHSMQIGTGARGCTSQYANWFGSKGVHVTACKLAQGREGARHSMQIGLGARGCSSQHASWHRGERVHVTACKFWPPLSLSVVEGNNTSNFPCNATIS